MKLKRLAITHLPGIHGGLALDGFGDGINVVTGPNASGKSSLIRALGHLIDPRPEPAGSALTLEAELVTGARTLTVTRSGSSIVWQERGRPVEPPPLPSIDFLACYWLSMEDLLAEGRTDDEIAIRVKRMLAGGFDLDAVRSATPFDIGPRHGQTQHRNLALEESAVNEIAARYEQLERERARLPELERRIREGELAAARAGKATRALEWLDARRERITIERRLAGFPAGMERLKGHEADRLDELDTRRRALEQRQAATRRELEAARARLDETGLGDAPPRRSELAAVRKDLEDLRDLGTRLERVRADQLATSAVETAAVNALRPVADGGLPPITPATVDRAVELAERLREAERSVLELEALEEIEAPSGEAISEHETLARELRRWLRQLEPKRFSRLFGAAVGALGLGLAAALISAGRGALLPAGLASAAAAAVLAVLAARGAAELSVAPPDTFTPDAVARRLADVEREHAALLAQRLRAAETAVRLEQLGERRAARDALAREKETLARAIGFDPSRTAESVARFAQLVRDHDAALAKQRELRLAKADLQRQLDERAKRVAGTLSRYAAVESADARDPNALRARLDALEARAEAHREAARSIQDAELALDGLAGDLRALDEELDQLYRDAGLEPGARDALRDRCAQFDEYRSLRAAQAHALTLEQERRSGVADDAELAARVEADDEAGLRALLGELELKAETLADDRERHASINARLELAGVDRALERARHTVEDARGELRDAYEQAMRADAARFLLDDVAEEHRAEQEPEVLAAARERFARYTHDRYSLLIGDDGRLRALDNRHGTEHEPETLSTGTRMQLLLAARLAWTAVAEKGRESLPIMLDEALTTSDPGRFESIARNLADTAEREGRQIFYLSAEPGDVIRFERALGKRPTHIDLGRAALGAAAEPEDYALPEHRPPPSPAGLTPAEYASRVGVPRIDPARGAGPVHLFYLLRDDLEQLHALLHDWHVTSVGQLEAMLRGRVAEHAVPSAAARERLAARCAIARAWADAWRQGRGARIDRNVLEASGAVSDRFIDEVTALAERLDGDAKRLIDALEHREILGFHRSKADELADWLEERGFLDRAAVLTADERVHGTLVRTAGAAAPTEVQRIVASLEAGAGRGTDAADSERMIAVSAEAESADRV